MCCDFALLLIKILDIKYLYQILEIVEIQKNHLENQFCNWKSISLVTIMDNSSCHSAAMHWVKFVSTKCGVGTVGHLPWAAVDPWQLKHGDEDGDLDCINLFIIDHLHFSRSDCCPHITSGPCLPVWGWHYDNTAVHHWCPGSKVPAVCCSDLMDGTVDHSYAKQ